MDAMCESLNEFLTTQFHDWVYLDPDAPSDLEACDQLITAFVQPQRALIPLLLSWNYPRQIFGQLLVNMVTPADRQSVIEQAFKLTVKRFDLAEGAACNAIAKLIGYLEGQAESQDAEAVIGPFLQTEDNSELASLIQALGVAIDLANLVVNADACTDRESELWRAWLSHFAAHPLLASFGRQLITRVHLARQPSLAYLRAASAFPTDDLRLSGPLESTSLLLLPTPSPLPPSQSLDPIASRRHLVVDSHSVTALLQPLLEVARHPRYVGFVRLMLRRMVEANDCWLEVAVLVTAVKGGGRRLTMQEVLTSVEVLLGADEGAND